MTWNNTPRAEWEQQALGGGGPRTRTDDYSTSVDGAESVKMRATSQQWKLLVVFASWGHLGCTDEAAASGAHLTRSCYWKRCGELRQMGLIEFTGEKVKGEAGVPRLVSAITEKGQAVLRAKRTYN